MELEEWRSIKGLEGRYEVSNMGNVRSLMDNLGRPRIKLRKLRMTNNGYLVVSLWMNGKVLMRKPHRLVAETFLDKPENAQCVNHINGIKTDNRASNLEWCTYSENTKHAIASGLVTNPAEHFHMKGKHGKEHPTSKPVEQLTLDGDVIAEYESGVEAAKALGVRAGSVQRCAAGARKTAFGYKWRYKLAGKE